MQGRFCIFLLSRAPVEAAHVAARLWRELLHSKFCAGDQMEEIMPVVLKMNEMEHQEEP